MALKYDPEHGDILNEQGRQVATLQPGPDRDRLGRQMAAAQEMVEALRGERLCHEQGCTRSTANALGMLNGFLAHGSLWLRKQVAERAREALRKAGVP